MPSTTERCFLLDLIHGVAVFDGPRSEMEEKRDRILRGCIIIVEAEDPAKFLLVVSAAELDSHAVDFMEKTRKIPKRVVMQLEQQCNIKVPSSLSASSLPRL